MIRLFCAIVMVLGGLAITADRSFAEPMVLHDSGEGVPIDPYLEPLNPKQTSLEEPPAPGSRPTLGPQSTLDPRPDLLEFSVAGFGLPVRTPSLTPGKVERRTIPTLEGKMVGASPLFIVGADQWSLQWLQQNREHLIGMRAAGMVVAVEKEQELEILRRAASGLPLFAASGEALAEVTGLRHYPALIAPPGVIAQ